MFLLADVDVGAWMMEIGLIYLDGGRQQGRGTGEDREELHRE